MRPVLALLLLLAATSSRAGDVWAVEVSMFNCAACAEFEPMTEALARELDGRLAIAALPESDSAPLARAYYALRDFAEPARVRHLIYQMIVTLRLAPERPQQIIEWTRMNGLDVPYDEVKQRMSSEPVMNSVAKAVRLGRMANVQTTPTIVFVKDGQVIGSVAKAGRDVQTFYSDVIGTAKRLGAIGDAPVAQDGEGQPRA